MSSKKKPISSPVKQVRRSPRESTGRNYRELADVRTDSAVNRKSIDKVDIEKRANVSFSETTPRTLLENFSRSDATVQSTTRKHPRVLQSPNKSQFTKSAKQRRSSLMKATSLRKKATMNNFFKTGEGPTPRGMIQGFVGAVPDQTPVIGTIISHTGGSTSHSFNLDKTRPHNITEDDSFMAAYEPHVRLQVMRDRNLPVQRRGTINIHSLTSGIQHELSQIDIKQERFSDQSDDERVPGMRKDIPEVWLETVQIHVSANDPENTVLGDNGNDDDGDAHDHICDGDKNTDVTDDREIIDNELTEMVVNQSQKRDNIFDNVQYEDISDAGDEIDHLPDKAGDESDHQPEKAGDEIGEESDQVGNKIDDQLVSDKLMEDDQIVGDHLTVDYNNHEQNNDDIDNHSQTADYVYVQGTKHGENDIQSEISQNSIGHGMSASLVHSMIQETMSKSQQNVSQVEKLFSEDEDDGDEEPIGDDSLAGFKPAMKQLKITDILHSPALLTDIDDLPMRDDSFAQLTHGQSQRMRDSQRDKPSTSQSHIKRTNIKSKPDAKSRVQRLPRSLTKSIFQHFSKSKRLSKEVLDEIEKVGDQYWRNITLDLTAYASHAHRKGIEVSDVELLMRRQGFVTENQSLYSLVEEYLPLEYRQELIPIARAGNVIFPKR